MAGARLVWAHCLGRPGSGAALGEWANSPELTMKLCDDEPATGYIGCHSKYDRHLDPVLREALLEAAALRLLRRLGRPTVLVVPADSGGLGAGDVVAEAFLKGEIRALVRELEEQEIRP